MSNMLLSDFEYGLQEIVKQLDDQLNHCTINRYSTGHYFNKDSCYYECITSVFGSELYTEELFEKYPIENKYKTIYCILSRNINISLDYIINHTDKPWVHEKINERPNITQEDLRKYPQIKWDIIRLSITWSKPPDYNYGSYGLK